MGTAAAPQKKNLLIALVAILVLLLAAGSIYYYVSLEQAKKAEAARLVEEKCQNLIAATKAVEALFDVRDTELASKVTTSTIDNAEQKVTKVAGSKETSLTASIVIARRMYSDQLVAQQAVNKLSAQITTAQVKDIEATSALVSKVTNAGLKKALAAELTGLGKQINDRIAKEQATAEAAAQAKYSARGSSSKGSSGPRSSSGSSPQGSPTPSVWWYYECSCGLLCPTEKDYYGHRNATADPQNHVLVGKVAGSPPEYLWGGWANTGPISGSDP